jgi:urease gamma subunit
MNQFRAQRPPTIEYHTQLARDYNYYLKLKRKRESTLFIMASSELQVKANQLNLRVENEAKITLDDIERNMLRPIARKAYACVVKCYDDAGSKGASETIENCSRQCQAPYEYAHQVVQHEVGNFQQRLQRAMMLCNDEASAMITPSIANDAKQMKKVEDTVLACITKVVDDHVKQLKPLKQRVDGQLKRSS